VQQSLNVVVEISELTGADLQRRLLVTVWQVTDDPALDKLLGATSFGVRGIASRKTVCIVIISCGHYFDSSVIMQMQCYCMDQAVCLTTVATPVDGH
jgi:hypothetical protein